ncbi:MAG TPA: formate/nitrite transporter family protein [Thermoanaerobaculia bacterium]|nr:formate/nitrite transporter family protein [Thermoanaerobaculia bacterium]
MAETEDGAIEPETTHDADAAPGADEPGTPTERSEQRSAEDREWVPVIVKRNDQAVRHPDDILTAAIGEGLEQLQRPRGSLALSALAAGMILAFTAMAVGVVTTLLAPYELPELTRLGAALVYPLGFIICLMAGTELFTEHTATAVYPVLDRKSGFLPMLGLWGLVGGFNLVGAFAGAGFLAVAEPVIGAREGYLEIGRHLVEFDSLPLFASALLAGWLMALAAWLMLSMPPSFAQIVLIYVVTFTIGLGGLHHSIAGSVELFVALLVGAGIGAGEVLRFLALALTGNLVGGSVFVALLNYGHIRQSQGKG